jgi:hypothetical protein
MPERVSVVADWLNQKRKKDRGRRKTQVSIIHETPIEAATRRALRGAVPELAMIGYKSLGLMVHGKRKPNRPKKANDRGPDGSPTDVFLKSL